jgi:hypothetical protein
MAISTEGAVLTCGAKEYPIRTAIAGPFSSSRPALHRNGAMRDATVGHVGWPLRPKADAPDGDTFVAPASRLMRTHRGLTRPGEERPVRFRVRTREGNNDGASRARPSEPGTCRARLSSRTW